MTEQNEESSKSKSHNQKSLSTRNSSSVNYDQEKDNQKTWLNSVWGIGTNQILSIVFDVF